MGEIMIDLFLDQQFDTARHEVRPMLIKAAKEYCEKYGESMSDKAISEGLQEIYKMTLNAWRYSSFIVAKAMKKMEEEDRESKT